MCDTLCVVGPRSTIFAKNSDRPVAEIQLIEGWPERAPGDELRTQYLGIPDPGAGAVLGARPDWLWGFEHGVNAAGVAMGNEKLVTTRDSEAGRPALIGMDLVRLCLERATSADDALVELAALVERYGQGGIADRVVGASYFSSFLIAGRGHGWVVETVGSSWWAAPVDRAAAISNRISLRSEQVTQHSPDLPHGFDPQEFIDPGYLIARADRRLACTLPALPSVGAPADAVSVLRHHGARPWGRPGSIEVELPPPDYDPVTAEGMTVCMHQRGETTTTSAMVAELPHDPAEPPRAWVATHSPCVAVFVPVFPEFPTPGFLGSAAWWRRFERLRLRVEADGDALTPIRAVTGPLEGDLWSEADDAIRRGPDAIQAYLASVEPRLDRALASLGV